MRRDINDKEWQAVKKRVKSRDKQDRMIKTANPIEYIILKKKAGPLIHTLDPAHFLAVSERPDLCYKSYNIVLLNRWSHENLDHFKDPITGDPITKEQVRTWWIRILKSDPDQFNYLKQKGLI